MPLQEKRLNLIGQALLFLATVIWGTSFFVLKDTLQNLPVMFVLAVRFVLASVILFLIFFKRIIKIKKRTLFVGLILGGILSTAYIFQTFGLKGVTPGENAFLTSTYVILVPFISWLAFKRKPSIYSFIAAVIGIVGIGCVAFYDGASFNVGWGQILTLISAVFYGLQIIVISIFGEKEDPIAVLFVQLFVVAIVCSVGSLFFEVGKVDISINFTAILKLLYLAIICTIVSQGFQIIGQRFVPTSQSALILSLEAVFGLIFSVIAGSEDLNLISVIGFVLIFISIIVSETKLEFITKLFKKDQAKEKKND